MKLTNKNKRLIKFGVLIVCVILLIKYSTEIGKLIALIFDAVFPLVLGLIVAFVLNILMRGFERIYFPNSKNATLIKSRRPVCLSASILLLALIVFAAVSLIIPELIRAFTILGEEIPAAIENLGKWVNRNLADTFLADFFNTSNTDWNELFPRITSFITSGATGLLDSAFSIASTTISGITTTVVALIFAIYLLANKENLIRQFKKLTRSYNPYSLEKLGHYISIANKTFSSFVIGQCTDALLLGIIIGVGMAIFRLPHALLTGVIVGITAWIPIFGAWIGVIIGSFLIFTVSPIKAIIFIVMFVVVQILEENIIYTRVVGSSVGLPSIWVLAAVTVGGSLFGVFGMVFSVPLAATIYKIVKERVNERLEAKSYVQNAPEALTETERNERNVGE